MNKIDVQNPANRSSVLKLGFLLFLCGFFLSICTFAQKGSLSEKWREYLELLAEQSESEDAVTELVENLEFFHQNPINLNDTVSNDLLKLFFVSEFQTAALQAYIRQNGSLLSVYELQLIYGFSEENIRLLLPFVCANPFEGRQRWNWKEVFPTGEHHFVAGFRQIFGEQKGFTPIEEGSRSVSRYTGSPFRNYLKYEFNYKRKLLVGFSADKDIGEDFFVGSQKQGYDFYSFHAAIRDISIFKTIVVGDYHLQFGQGLTLWTGFGYKMPVNTVFKKYAQGVKPSASFTEYGTMRGLAATAEWKDFTITTFASHAKRDASIKELDEAGNIKIVSSILQTGYHRTGTELANKNALTETLFGGNIHFRKNIFSAGFTAYKTLLSAKIEPDPAAYNIHYFRGTENFNIGMDMALALRKVNFFGELSYSANNAFAGLIGMQCALGENTSLSLLYRNYAKNYQNFYALPVGQSSHPQNESGLLMAFQTSLFWSIRALLEIDVFQFPWLRYQANNPSVGQEIRLNLSKSLKNRSSVNFLYRLKNNAANSSSEGFPVVPAEEICKQSFQLNFEYGFANVWNFNSRVEYNLYLQEKNLSSGFLIYQDVNYNPIQIPLSFSLRYAIFDADNYENRLYAYERDFLYEYSVPAYNYKGSRFYLMVNWDVTENFRFGARYSIWYYPERETIGSGLDESIGNTRQEIKLQARLKIVPKRKVYKK